MFALRTLTRRSAPAMRIATQQRAMSGIAVNNVSRIAKFKPVFFPSGDSRRIQNG